MATAKTLEAALSGLWENTVEVIDLERQRIGDEDAVQLGNLLATNTSVRSINLDDNIIRDAGAAGLGAGLAKNTSVTKLSLTNNSIGDAGAASLGAGLAKNPSVKVVSLNRNHIGDAGGSALVKFLMQNSALIEIDLEFNVMGDTKKAVYDAVKDKSAAAAEARKQWEAVLSGLRDNTVKEIDPFFDYGEWECTNPPQAITSARNPKHLLISAHDSAALHVRTSALNLGIPLGNDGGGRSFFDMGIEDADAVQLGDLLAKNTSVKGIDLNSNAIGDAGAASLGAGLSKNRSVTYIELSNNNIGDAGAVGLGAGLAKNTTVTSVSIDGNNIGDAGAAALEQTLMQNSAVTSIYLGDNPMSDASKEAVLDAVKHKSAAAATPAPLWDQRKATSAAAWMSLLVDRPSGTFVVRASSSADARVVGTITVVRPGGTTASSTGSFFNKRVLRDSTGTVKLQDSVHTHASLELMIAFYQNPAYFSSSAKVDVPTKLLFQTESLYEELNPGLFWRDASSGGGGSAATLANGEMIYGEVHPLDDGGDEGSDQGGGYESNYVELHAVLDKLWNVTDDIAKNFVGISPTFLDCMTELKRHGHYKFDIEAKAKEALAHAQTHRHVGTVQRAGAEALTADDIAAIRMYTYAHPNGFYARLNEELGGYCGGEGRAVVDHFLPYTKLLRSALDKLPPVSKTLFRGSKMDYEALLRTGIRVGDQASWNQFTSCSTTPGVLEEDWCLGKKAAGTVFQVVCVAGYAIQAYSAYPTENEVLLPAGSKFVVDKISRKTEDGVTEVRMRQLVL